MSDKDVEVIKYDLQGKTPDFIRGYLAALKRFRFISEADERALVEWATAESIKRSTTGLAGGPSPRGDDPGNLLGNWRP